MKKLFYMGGPLFMAILTVILIVLVAWAVYHFLPALMKKKINFIKTRSRLKQIKTIGAFALVTGILGQLIGLYQAFGVIEEMGNVPQSVLMGGLKVSIIPALYGIFIYLVSLTMWFLVDLFIPKKTE